MSSELNIPVKPSKAPIYWSIGSMVVLVVFVVGCVMLISNRKPTTNTSLSVDLSKPADRIHGARLYQVSCATCHGPVGKGLPHQGAPLVGSAYLMGTDEMHVIQMVKIGRTPSDPKSVMKLAMPARGGFNNLSDQDLRDIVAHIKTLSVPNSNKVSSVTQ